MADESTPTTGDTDAATPEAPQDTLPEIDINVEEAGTLKKKITVTIPRKRIDAKFNEMFGELSNTAQVPGFRIGHAPRKLIEKRFGKEVSQDVRNAVIGESISDAIDKSTLKTIGEPDLELDKLELPETGDMSYDFQIEVQPEFDLPELKGIEVKKTAAAVTDERIDEYIQSLLESRAQYEPTDDPAEEGDMIVGGAVISAEGIEPVERHGLQLRVAPGQVEGLPLVDLAEALEGKKASDTVDVKVTGPEAHPNEAWRDKELTVSITVSEVRSRNIPDLDEALAEQMGFDSLKAMREYVGQIMTSRIESETQRDMREQISQYLLDNATFDLPEGLVSRQTASVLKRRYVDLLYQGVPKERIDENLTQLQAAAGEQAQRSLRLTFITGKIAEARELNVDDDEVNARIAQMAAQSGKRPERLKQELAQDGSLEQVRGSLLDEKILDALLADAQVTEVPPEPTEEKPKKTPKKASKAKKASKSADKKEDAGDKPEAKAEKAPAKKAAKKTVKKAAKKAPKKK